MNEAITTQKSIAEKLGISRRAVGYAINGTGRIGESTRKQVLELAREYNHFPNMAARALATGRSNIVALRLPTLRSRYSTRVLEIMEQLTEAAGYDLVVKNSHSAKLCQWRVDGCIVLDPFAGDPSAIETYNIPEVAFGCYSHEAVPQQDYVGCDLFYGTGQAMDHLFGLGCRSILYIGHKMRARRTEPRLFAYRDLMAREELPTRELILEDDLFAQAKDSLRLQEYLTETGKPDAILCANDEVALSACRAVGKLGLGVPSEVKIVGCDGTAEGAEHEPSLTSIEFPYELMCQEAWNFLVKRMASPQAPPQRALHRPTLRIRQSSGLA